MVTGSRADYGLLYEFLKEVKKDKALKLQLVVSGMHLSKEHGMTYKTILKDGFDIDEKVNVLRFDDTSLGVTESIGLGCRLFAKAFFRLKPDWVVLLGDRFEILSSAIAAYMARIPIAHIHGGESTQGVVDEGIRHSITKMATLHFVSTEDYRKRVIQMGERPESVFNFGAPGLDVVHKQKLLNKRELARELRMDLSRPTALVTFHPETLNGKSPAAQIKGICSALKQTNMRAIFTKANADMGGRSINETIKKFCLQNGRNNRLFDSLGQLRYMSCLQHCDIMVGNSSSGIIEAASFGIPVVNIGDRQKGRVRGTNVIDVQGTKSGILAGIKKGLSKPFARRISRKPNPYERYRDGKVSRRIKDKIKSTKIAQHLLKKQFYDLRFS